MTEHVYKSLELTGSSSKSVEDAVNNAIAKAAKTLHNLRWFRVTEVLTVTRLDHRLRGAAQARRRRRPGPATGRARCGSDPSTWPPG